MDLFDVIRACLRRWYVTVPLLAVTLAYSYYTYSTVKPVYYSHTVIGVSAPNSQVPWGNSGEPIPQNGLLAAGGPPLLTQMLVFGLNDVEMINKVASEGGKTNYTVRMFPTGGDIQNSSLPLVMVETTQADPESAKKTVGLVASHASTVLRQIQQQAGVPESLMVQTLVASAPIPPQAGTPSRIRSTFAMAVSGVGLTVVAAVIVDALLLRRRRSGPVAAGPPASDASAAPASSATENQHRHALQEPRLG